MLSEFPFLYRFTVLLNSGGSNSPWSEFWSEFPHFMGMGVAPASSSQSIAQKGVRAVDAQHSQPEMAKMLQKPVFALPACQPMSANTLLCDTLGLAEI